MTHRPEDYYGSSSSGQATGSGSGSGFGTYLEGLQSDLQFHTDDAESRVISALSDGGSGDISDLMSRSGYLPLSLLLQAIERLERFRLVERTSNPDGDVYRLSTSGRRASQMMGLWSGVA